MARFIFILAFLVSSLHSFSQGKGKVKMNLVDSAGRKTGFWVEDVGGLKTETYYQKGLKEGVEKVYYRKGTLAAFLTYKNGHTVGRGYYFLEDGKLSFTVDYLGFQLYHGKRLQKGYFILYDENGLVSEKGTGLYKEGEEELGDEIKIGNWIKVK